MKSFIDTQIELSVKYQSKLRSIKHATQLLRTNPTSSQLLSMRAELQVEAADILNTMVKNVMPGKDTNVVDMGVVTIAEKFFEND